MAGMVAFTSSARGRPPRSTNQSTRPMSSSSASRQRVRSASCSSGERWWKRSLARSGDPSISSRQTLTSAETTSLAARPSADSSSRGSATGDRTNGICCGPRISPSSAARSCASRASSSRLASGRAARRSWAATAAGASSGRCTRRSMGKPPITLVPACGLRRGTTRRRDPRFRRFAEPVPEPRLARASARSLRGARRCGRPASPIPRRDSRRGSWSPRGTGRPRRA